jgi:hypothetical protein
MLLCFSPSLHLRVTASKMCVSYTSTKPSKDQLRIDKTDKLSPSDKISDVCVIKRNYLYQRWNFGETSQKIRFERIFHQTLT